MHILLFDSRQHSGDWIFLCTDWNRSLASKVFLISYSIGPAYACTYYVFNLIRQYLSECNADIHLLFLLQTNRLMDEMHKLSELLKLLHDSPAWWLPNMKEYFCLNSLKLEDHEAGHPRLIVYT